MFKDSRTSLLIYTGAGLLLVVIAIVLFYQPSAVDESATIDTTTVPTVENSETLTVPAVPSPIKEATPAVNPTEAANPFADTDESGAEQNYQNPFE